MKPILEAVLLQHGMKGMAVIVLVLCFGFFPFKFEPSLSHTRCLTIGIANKMPRAPASLQKVAVAFGAIIQHLNRSLCAGPAR